MPINKNTQRKERGQSLVELALTMTLMLIILAGVADIGRAFYTYISMRDAAQEGALYAEFAFRPDASNKVNAQAACQEIRDRVTGSSSSLINLATEVNLSIQYAKQATPNAWNECTTGSQIAIKPSAGDLIRVTLTHNGFKLATPFLGTLIGTQTVNISTSIQDVVLAPYQDNYTFK